MDCYKHGEYTTHTSYFLALEKKDKTCEEIRLNEGFNLNKDVWQTKVSPKLQMLLWRAAKGALSVESNLLRRKVTLSDACIRCGDPKSEMHLFFHCPFGRQTWDIAPLQKRTNVDLIPDIKEGIKLGKTISCLSAKAPFSLDFFGVVVSKK